MCSPPTTTHSFAPPIACQACASLCWSTPSPSPRESFSRRRTAGGTWGRATARSGGRRRRSRRALRGPSTRCRRSSVVGAWAASFTPTVVVYAIFDAPLYQRAYVPRLHDFIEFHPLTNWAPFLFGLCLGNLLRRAEGADADGACVARALWALRHVGATIPLLAAALFFSFATPPRFEMGTYYLLFDKGPATLPVVALLLAACTRVPLTDPLGGRLLRHLAPLGCLSWAAYILHVPLSAALSDLDGDAFDFLWLKPLCMLLIIGAAHIMVDRPFRQYVRQALRERGPGWRSLPTIVVESINLDEVERQRAIGVSLLTAPRRDRLRVCEPAEPESLTRP